MKLGQLLLVLILGQAASFAAGKISETDKKEIVRILFDRVFPKSDDSKKQMVLLDPNTNLSLIAKIPCPTGEFAQSMALFDAPGLLKL
jgi:hypothetical protein